MSAFTSMLGPLLGGMFQPGTDAKAQAQGQQDAKYAQFKSGMANTTNGNLFGMSPAMQKITNFPIQTRDVGKIGSAPETQASSGWDAFLSGAAKIAGNFATGVMAGLQGYDPRNEYSSLAAGYIGATRGLRTQADIEEAQMRGAAAMQMKEQERQAAGAADLAQRRAAAGLESELKAQEQAQKEAEWRRQAGQASVASPGIAIGIGAVPPMISRPNDLDVLVGVDPLGAATNVGRLIGVQR